MMNFVMKLINGEEGQTMAEYGLLLLLITLVLIVTITIYGTALRNHYTNINNNL